MLQVAFLGSVVLAEKVIRSASNGPRTPLKLSRAWLRRPAIVEISFARTSRAESKKQATRSCRLVVSGARELSCQSVNAGEDVPARCVRTGWIGMDALIDLNQDGAQAARC